MKATNKERKRMRKRRRSGGRDGAITAKRRRQHLYLVVDDWFMGHSIRKVDLSSGSKSGNSTEPLDGFPGERSEQQLPPALFHLESDQRWSTTAFGTKIITMPPYLLQGDIRPNGIVSVFDVRTRCFSFVPRPRVDLSYAIYIPFGDRLFVLCSDSFQVLETDPNPVEETDGPCWAGLWRELPKHPFPVERISSYAVHPNERTLFVSIKHFPSSGSATYSFSTVKKHFEWKQRGEWELPFMGRAHFDRNLEAWVGLSGDRQTMGYICACDVVSAKSDGSGGKCPSWKVSKEKLFSEDPAERLLGADLVYMAGRRSKFCLVQCVSLVDHDEEMEKFRYFRLTTFSLQYDKNGDLTTGNTRRVRYYKAPEETIGFTLMYPAAFWM